MIPNITRGADFHGLMRYLAGPGRANEHTNPHLVAGDDTVTAWAPTGKLTQPDARALADELQRPTLLAGRAPKAGPVWHCSLSVKAEDGPLTQEQWQEIGGRFVDKMGWSAAASGRSPMPWLAVHHGLSKAGNDHVHLVVSMVREDGTLVNTHNDFARAQQACRELEAELALTPVTGPAVGLGTKGLTAAELNQQTRTGREPARLTLERVVRGASTMANTEAEFVDAVRAAGVRIAPYYAKGDAGTVTGYKVGLRGEGERMYGGGHLSKDLTLPRLRLRWEHSPEHTAAAVTAWRNADPARPVQPTAGAVTAAQFDQVNRQLNVVADRVRSIPPGDLETWAQVAHDTAGIFAAWSRAAEGDTPGPLAAAAAAARQLGQANRWAITGSRATRPVTTGAALLAHQFAIGGQGKVGQAIFLRQLLNTLYALHEAARAMKQTRIAEAIASAVRQDLVTLVASMPPIPEDVMAAHGHCPTVAQAEAALRCVDLVSTGAAALPRPAPTATAAAVGGGPTRVSADWAAIPIPFDR